VWLIVLDLPHSIPRRIAPSDLEPRAVATCCEDYGRRLQQSVFLCDCSPDATEALYDAVTAQMDPAADHFVLMALCARCTEDILQHGVEKSLPGNNGPLVV